MPLHPQAKAVLDAIAASGIPQTHEVPPVEARAAAIARRALTAGEPETVARVVDRSAPGPAGDIRVRVYSPRPGEVLPALVYFHGGGWVIGSIETHDQICRALANATPCVVVSVDYRLAPEHRYPAAAEDCYAATCWLADNAATLDVDPSRIAVGGDSAGGNLAAVVALMARDRGAPSIAFQLLIYPVADFSFDTPSYRENARGYNLTRESMEYFWQHYLGNSGRGHEAYASPLRATDLRSLPPAWVITAEFDPLRDEGAAYAERLRAAGVLTTYACYPGQVHGFFGMLGAVDAARQAIDEGAAAMRAAFDG